MRFLPLATTAAVFGIAAFGQETRSPEPIPITFSLSGAEMYTTWCASCHGALGKGRGLITGVTSIEAR